MKYKIVLINFPFDDFSRSKLRPALCLTNPIGRHNHIVFIPISSNLDNATECTDFVLNKGDEYFEKTGLKVSSVFKIHRLLTSSDALIVKSIGNLPVSYQPLIVKKIKLLFGIDI